jgi:hypothetical protein
MPSLFNSNVPLQNARWNQLAGARVLEIAEGTFQVGEWKQGYARAYSCFSHPLPAYSNFQKRSQRCTDGCTSHGASCRAARISAVTIHLHSGVADCSTSDGTDRGPDHAVRQPLIGLGF